MCPIMIWMLAICMSIFCWNCCSMRMATAVGIASEALTSPAATSIFDMSVSACAQLLVIAEGRHDGCDDVHAVVTKQHVEIGGYLDQGLHYLQAQAPQGAAMWVCAQSCIDRQRCCPLLW